MPSVDDQLVRGSKIRIVTVADTRSCTVPGRCSALHLSSRQHRANAETGVGEDQLMRMIWRDNGKECSSCDLALKACANDVTLNFLRH